MLKHLGFIILLGGIVGFFRLLPFFLSTSLFERRWIKKISTTLPACILILLVVHAVQSAHLTSSPYALPELIGIGCVILIHLVFKNTLLSIAGSTCLYIFIIRILQ